MLHDCSYIPQTNKNFSLPLRLYHLHTTWPLIRSVEGIGYEADHPLHVVQGQDTMKLCLHSTTHFYGMLLY
jgi:hypothetical protein